MFFKPVVQQMKGGPRVILLLALRSSKAREAMIAGPSSYVCAIPLCRVQELR